MFKENGQLAIRTRVAYRTRCKLLYYEFDPFVCSYSQLILRLRIVQALDGISVMGKASAYGKLWRKTCGPALKHQAVLQPATLLFEWSKAVGELGGPYTYESGSRVRLGSGSHEPNSSVCGAPRSYGCGEINPSPAPRRAGLASQTRTCMGRLRLSLCTV
jgi:hypothetical protein